MLSVYGCMVRVMFAKLQDYEKDCGVPFPFILSSYENLSIVDFQIPYIVLPPNRIPEHVSLKCRF